MNTLIGGAVAGALALLIALVYYRAVIYIVFGAKRVA